MDADKGCTAGFDRTCTYSLSPVGGLAPYRGRRITVRVSATGEQQCPVPELLPEEGWLRAEVVSFRKNKGVVRVTVARNESSLWRIGGVWIGDREFVVVQGGAPCVILGIDPLGAAYPGSGGQGAIAVSAPQGCQWSAGPDSETGWVSILSGGTGTGDGTVRYAVEANTTGRSRTGRVLVVSPTGSRKIHRVMQAK